MNKQDIGNGSNIIQIQGQPIQVIMYSSIGLIFTIVGIGAIVSLISTVNRQFENTIALGCFGGLVTLFGLLMLIWGVWNVPRQIIFDSQKIVVMYALRQQVFNASSIETITCESVISVTRSVRRQVDNIKIVFEKNNLLEFNSDTMRYNYNEKTSFEDLTTHLKQLYNL